MTHDQILHHLRQKGSRPRPLPNGRQALFVDVENHDLARHVGGRDPRQQPLVPIKGFEPQRLNGKRVEGPDHAKREQHDEPDPAGTPKPIFEAVFPRPLTPAATARHFGEQAPPETLFNLIVV